MKIKALLSLCACLSVVLSTAQGATLGVSVSDHPNGVLTSYSYQFSVTGANAGIDTVFLGSGDLSPLNLAFTVDGATRTDWSFLGNNSPQNYLEFFSTDGSSLNAGDTLGVTFNSIFAPGSSAFAIAENSVTGAVTNEVTGIAGPAVTTTPEPASAGLIVLAGAILLLLGGFRFARRAS